MRIISYYSLPFFFYCFLITVAQVQLCSQGCLSCIYKQLRCTACSQGFELTYLGKCLKTNGSNNCAIFGSGVSQCLKCKSTYRLINNTCAKDYSGCLDYNNGTCVRCGYGTTILNGSCTGVLNCKYYKDGCKQCERGYIYNINRCFYVQRDCAKVEISSGACEVCGKGLELNAFSCLSPSLKRDNCDIYDQNGCLLCKSGFGLWEGQCKAIPQCQEVQHLNASFDCVDLPYGCRGVSEDNACLSCFQNYQLLNFTCFAVLPKNCLNVSINGKCVNCSGRYYSDGYSCKSVSRYCLAFNTIGKCLNCTYSYFTNSAGICKDPFCLNQTLDFCLQCRQLYRYDNISSRCIIFDPHCLNSSAIGCFDCSGGYYPSTDVCLPLPDNCLKANQRGECLRCESNYFLQFDKCFIVNQTIQHCITYDGYSYLPKCLQCETGFFVALGRCVEIPPYCSMVLSNGKCVVCIANFKLVNQKCQSVNSLNIDQKCTAKDKGLCQRCASGYALGTNNVCYLLGQIVCLKSDESGLCLSCDGGLVVSRKACLAAILIDINCKSYQGSICKQCYSGYFLFANSCNLPNIDCKSYSLINGGCQSCYPGYTLTNRQCVVTTKVENCLAYDGKGNCMRCEKFFYISSLKCVKVNPLCSGYNEFTGGCRACYAGFELKNESCVQLSVASWFDSGRNSIVTVETCRQYNATTGRCAVCIAGYFIQNGRCINYASLSSSDPSCKLYLNISYCKECFSGFIAVGGACKVANPLCKSISQVSGECTSCYQGYNLAYGNCEISGGQQFDPCIQRQSSALCLKCLAGYNLIEGRCVFTEYNAQANKIPFCQVVTNSSFCKLCQNGFYLRSGACYQVSEYCKTYNPENGQCLTCKDSYVFSQGTCLYPALGLDSFCSEYKGVYCSNCQSGYYLKSYVCSPIDPRCLQFNFSVNQCLRCSSGRPVFDICQ